MYCSEDSYTVVRLFTLIESITVWLLVFPESAIHILYTKQKTPKHSNTHTHTEGARDGQTHGQTARHDGRQRERGGQKDTRTDSQT